MGILSPSVRAQAGRESEMGTSSAFHEGELTGLEPGPLGWVRTALIKAVLRVEPAKCSYEPAAIQSSNGMDVFGMPLLATCWAHM